MGKPGIVIPGAVAVLFGLLFTLQGVGILGGSAMSNTMFWSIAGPVIMVIGLIVIGIGLRRPNA